MNGTSVRGFTVIEVIVVLGIIGILSAIVFASFGEARANARDKARLSDLAQIQLALKLYQQENGHYPREGDGLNGQICTSCTTNPLNNEIQQYLGDIPEDPRHDGSQYYYYYDGNQDCGGNPAQAVIAIRNLEQPGKSNADETKCTSWEGEGGIGEQGSYMIILGPSDG